MECGPVGALGQEPGRGGKRHRRLRRQLRQRADGAINSLEATQANATTASQQLATGQLTDPTQAITSVENASLAMDLASQVRTKLTDAVNTVFQTQV